MLEGLKSEAHGPGQAVAREGGRLGLRAAVRTGPLGCRVKAALGGKGAQLHLALWIGLLVCLWLLFPKRVGQVWLLEGPQRMPVTLPWFLPREAGTVVLETIVRAPIETVSVRTRGCDARLDVIGRATLPARAGTGSRTEVLPAEAGVPGAALSARAGTGSQAGYAVWGLPGRLSPGGQALRFTLRKTEPEAWFDIKEAHGFTWLKVLGLLVWGLGAFALARRCGYGFWPGWPVAFAGLLAVQCLDVTTPWLRQHDVGAHREYIEHLLAHRELPAVLQGWETWQPPLYYCIAAAWQRLWPGGAYDDPFRPVQYLGAALYLAAVVAALLAFQRHGLTELEAAGGLCALVLLPGHLFFAGRINNDVLLPVLGAGVMLATAEFLRTGERRWRWWLAILLPAALATKGSSLAIVGGALLLVLWAEARRSGWRPALWRTYLTGLPAGIWQLAWCLRTAAQTGDPLYVNTPLLPENLRLHCSAWSRLLSFNFPAFLGGGFCYDEPIRQSYPTALVTTMLYGEYEMHEYWFRWPGLLRWACLGLLLLTAAGALFAPRNELRPVWITCLVLAGCQAAITTAYAFQYPFACNQNMRFFAQAFVPLCCLSGLGLGRFWHGAGRVGRCGLCALAGAFLLGLADFYSRVLL